MSTKINFLKNERKSGKMRHIKRFRQRSAVRIIFVVLVSQLTCITASNSQAEVVSSKSSSIKIGGDDGWVYSVRCWQEGREIISEANLGWSAQSTRVPMRESVTFTAAEGRQSQLMIIPIGSAVCQVHGRQKPR